MYRALIVLGLLFTVAATSVVGLAQVTFSQGQAVEVRQGDHWSSAKVLKKEGRRYLIRRNEGDREEWVASDALRPLDGPATAASPAIVDPATRKSFATGDRVEVKDGRYWVDGIIEGKQGEWFRVRMGELKTLEWVQPWSMRVPGSDYDVPFTVHALGDRMPADGPGPAPAAARGDPFLVRDQKRAAAAVAAQKEPDEPVGDPEQPFDARDARAKWLEFGNVPWEVAPDITPTVASKPAVIKGCIGKSSPRQIAVSGGAVPIAAVLSRSGGDAKASIDLVNLADGKTLSLQSINTGSDMELIDISPDGSQILLRNRGQDRLQIWQIDGAKPAKRLDIVQYSDQPTFQREIVFAAFVDSDRFITGGGRDELVLWDIPQRKAVYATYLPHRTRPAISPGRQLLVFPTAGAGVVIEAASGKPLGRLPMPSGTMFAFEPSGKEIVAADQRALRLISLADGQVKTELTLPGYYFVESVQSAGEGLVLVNGDLLVDMRKHMALWQYSVPEYSAFALTPAGELLSVVDATLGEATLVPTRLPSPAAAKAAASTNPGDVLALYPGVRLSIDVRMQLPKNEQTSIIDHIKEECKRNDFVLADAQPVQVVVGQRQLARPGNQNAPTDKKSPAVLTYMSVVAEGLGAWTVGARSVPPEDGKSQQAPPEDKRYLEYFTTARFPVYLLKARTPLSLGRSKATVQGFE